VIQVLVVCFLSYPSIYSVVLTDLKELFMKKNQLLIHSLSALFYGGSFFYVCTHMFSVFLVSVSIRVVKAFLFPTCAVETSVLCSEGNSEEPLSVHTSNSFRYCWPEASFHAMIDSRPSCIGDSVLNWLHELWLTNDNAWDLGIQVVEF
jgi:hypothetical protein